MQLRLALAACLLSVSASGVRAQEPADPVQALIEQERVRSLVESAFARATEARRTHADDTAFVEAYTDIAYDLGTAEPAVIPLLANEAIQSDPATFYLAAYALAFHATPEAIEALHTAVERADGEQTSYAADRKTFLAWAIAAAGDVRAVRLADQGRHEVGDKAAYRMTTVLEAAAILTAPASLEILHRELSEDDVAPADERRRTLYSMRALAKIGDPASLPILLARMKSDTVLERMEAAKGLALYPGKAEVVDALVEALGDEAEAVSGYAAYSLLFQLPQGQFEKLAERLETVTSPPARRALYKLLAQLDGPAAIPILASHARTPDSTERHAVYVAAAMIRSPEVLDLLVHGLTDPDNRIGIRVVDALADMDSARARRILVRAIDSPLWPVAQTAAQRASRSAVPGAVEAIRERLLKRELPALVSDSTERPRAEWLLDVLAEAEDIGAIAGLEKALDEQVDPILLGQIETTVRRLKAARDAGDDFERWKGLAFDDDPAIRATAYFHLGRSSDADAAAKVLAMAFSRAEPTEGEKILERIADLDGDASRQVVERVLTSPEYQRPELYSMRNTAAWAARRLGGERMRAALRRSIEMRHGRDVCPIIYYTLLSGKDATPLIEELIAARMRFRSYTRGNEYVHLRKMLLKLKLDHSLDYTDLPPAQLRFK